MKEMIKKERKSNIELLRIISMCLIIYHHFSLNLGIIEGYDISKTMIFGILGGIGGKIGVVCYVLTTGYFSVEKDFNVKRVFKLWLQIFCYSVGFMLFFSITGIEKLNNVDTIKTFFPFAYNQYWFMTAYLYLMVLTPFINKLLNVLKQQDYKKMIVVLTIFLVIIPTIFYTSGMIGSTLTPIGVILFVYLYIIGGYIKLYGLKFFENKKAKNMFLIVLGYVIITCLVLIGKKLEQYNVFWNKIFEYYRELNSIFILIPSISLFYIFKEIDIGCNKIINYFASISLGVYLFHESNFMRYRLWHEILTIEKIQKLPGGVITGLVISIVSFYAITAFIEFFRINLIEKNILKSKTINRLFNKINNYMSI